MSVTTEGRKVEVMKPVRVYRCDGPKCTVTIEQPATLKVMTVPPGWIYVQIEDPAVEGKHYHSQACLVKGMQT